MYRTVLISLNWPTAFGVITLLMLTSGCSTLSGFSAVESMGNENQHVTMGDQLPESDERNARPHFSVASKQQLYDQPKRWKGTPYKLGGLNKNGIDCSGFVYLIYQQKFGKTISRTTGAQVRSGKAISKSQLTTGDLVFFKTGYKVRHVGIYVENGTFLHASTSKGVMISRLDGPYWNARFWQARRLLN